jgi:hypothetical protein
MPRRRYPSRPCLVCGNQYDPGQPTGKCCGPVCSLVMCAVKGLKRAMRPRERDQWTRVGLRVFRAAWKA